MPSDEQGKDDLDIRLSRQILCLCRDLAEGNWVSNMQNTDMVQYLSSKLQAQGIINDDRLITVLRENHQELCSLAEAVYPVRGLAMHEVIAETIANALIYYQFDINEKAFLLYTPSDSDMAMNLWLTDDRYTEEREYGLWVYLHFDDPNQYIRVRLVLAKELDVELFKAMTQGTHYFGFSNSFFSQYMSYCSTNKAFNIQEASAFALSYARDVVYLPVKVGEGFTNKVVLIPEETREANNE